MPTPSTDIINLLAVFSVAFTAPAFVKGLTLLYGTILAPGRRTVASALRMMGLADDPHFTNYHRFLNRDRWSPWILSKLLLGLLVEHFLPEGAPLMFLIDDTLERRRGKRIQYKSYFYDPVRSSAEKAVTSLGLRWICLALVVPVPWSQRPWALPVMTLLTLAPKTSQKLGKPHRTVTDWAEFMIARVRRWQPEREIRVVGDGRYACIALIATSQQLNQPVRFVSRLRLDAVLHEFPGPQPKSKRGPKPKKGERLPNLATRLGDPTTAWRKATLRWYGGEEKEVEIVSQTCLWYHRGLDPVSIRWVLVRCPDESFEPAAFFCSDASVSALEILSWYLERWNIEVTFAEVRTHLGFETQRQWSERAIERTTPCLLGVFSLVALMAKVLHPQTLPVRQAHWYPKEGATFCDALAAVRSHLWKGANYGMSSSNPDMFLIPEHTLTALLDVACYST